MPIVGMPDGTQVEFPDEMPTEQIKGLIASKFPAVVPKSPEDPVNKMMAGIISSLASKDRGFSAVTQPISSFIDTQKERGAHLNDIVNATSQGKKALPEGIAEGAMNSIAGPIGDIAGTGASIAGKVAYDMSPSPIQNTVDYAQKKIAPIAEAYQQNQDAYSKQNPRMGDAFRAVREGANLLPLGSTEVRNVVGAGTQEAGQAFKNIATDTGKAAIAKTAEALKPEAMFTSDAVKQMARTAYDIADQKGGVLTPNFANKLFDSVDSMKPQTLHGQATVGKDALNNLSEDWKILRDKPISLQAAQEMDEGLSQKIDGFVDKTTGKLDKEGQKLYDVQTQFRDMIDKTTPQDIAGGKDGFEALKAARSYWSTALRIGDMERILTRATMTDNPATSIKAGFRTLYNNPSRMRGYTGAERAAIKRAAQSGMISGTLRTVLGSRLIGTALGTAIGGAGAGMYGAAVGGGIGATQAAASRALAATMQRGRAKKVIKTISKRI